MDDLLITLPSKIRSAAMAVRGCLQMLPPDRPPAPAVLALLNRAALDLEGLVGQVESFSDRQRQVESDRRIASAKSSMSRSLRNVLKRRR
jgi:hypothetical protein